MTPTKDLPRRTPAHRSRATSGPETRPAPAATSRGAALWRQRLFEAEAGMTRYVAERAEPDAIDDWIAVRSELFADLPPRQDGHLSAWQAVFFRGQALMERFLVTRWGHDAMADWALRNAQVHRLVEPDRGGGACDPILRIGRQAELYGSRFSIDAHPEESTVEIEHCAIWDYRERARSRGVTITLRSPCEYCTKATAANIRAQGYDPAYVLVDGPGGPGCRWTATVPADGEARACAA